MDTLAEVLQADGRELVKSGHIELLGILRGLESDGFNAIQWGLIRELRGDILSIQGRWDEAEEEYAAAIPTAKKHKEVEILARLLSARADIAIKRGAMDDALELHRQALEFKLQKETRLAHRDHTSTWVTFSVGEETRGTRWKYMRMWKNCSMQRPTLG